MSTGKHKGAGKGLKVLAAIICLLLLVLVSAGQAFMPGNTGFGADEKGMDGVNKAALERLRGIPRLPVPEKYLDENAPVLPPVVDNSIHPYMPPMIWQYVFDCGQVAGVYFTFTYEINRLRGLSSYPYENIYPSGFTWNFMNQAAWNKGVSYIDSWEIIRDCGNPNVPAYGGYYNYGGLTYWMSGYDKYYQAMQNRIEGYYSIHVKAEEGLQVLKHYLHDHLDGSQTGGLANFYAHLPIPMSTLAVGTPEQGKVVIPVFPPNAGHAFTIVGYNDSVRWDYNGDGKFTNDLDINEDGKVDMQDWEIGALKVYNSQGSSWGNLGACYVMYKTFADDFGNGGIWDNVVQVLKVKEKYTPLLTLKAKIKHTSRGKLGISAGVSTNTNDTTPAHILTFPIFHFQGGDHYMQGDTTEAAKTMEIGLDITPLLNVFESSASAKFFLIMEEKDSTNQDDGNILSCSLIDYSSGFQEISATGLPVNIRNNRTTFIPMVHQPEISKPVIQTDSIPGMMRGFPFYQQLTATNGMPGYHWQINMNYDVVSEPIPPPPPPGGTFLNMGTTGVSIHELLFSLPFYDSSFSTIYIHGNGVVTFSGLNDNWPYSPDQKDILRSHLRIVPFQGETLIIPENGDGVWFEASRSTATIRWRCTPVEKVLVSQVDFALVIDSTGRIEFHYGNMDYPENGSWVAGISRGDQWNCSIFPLDESSGIPVMHQIKLTRPPIQTGIRLSEDGILSGIPEQPILTGDLNIFVRDNRSLQDKKSIPFMQRALLIHPSAHNLSGQVLQYGDIAMVDLQVANPGTLSFQDVLFTLRSDDPYITIIDSVFRMNTLPTGDSISLFNLFSFLIEPNTPDGHILALVIHANASNYHQIRPFDLSVSSPMLEAVTYSFPDDPNDRLEAGETTRIGIVFQNTGSAGSAAGYVKAAGTDNLITLLTDSVSIPAISPLEKVTLDFLISADGSTPDDYLAKLNLTAVDGKGVVCRSSLFLQTGHEHLEDFESADFTRFPWNLPNYKPWGIVNDTVFQGSHAARSAGLFHSDQSNLDITLTTLRDDSVIFYLAVSSEKTLFERYSDYAGFFIDGSDQGAWDGAKPWQRITIPVKKGVHMFRWMYRKDSVVTVGNDGVWLDNIRFPDALLLTPVLSTIPDTVLEVSLYASEQESASIMVMNTGKGSMYITHEIFGNLPPWMDFQSGTMLLPSGGKIFLPIGFNSSGLGPGVYSTRIRIKNQLEEEKNIHVVMHVLFPPGVDEPVNPGDLVRVFPNPFNDLVNILIRQQTAGWISIDIIDLFGRKVKNLFEGSLIPGEHHLSWDGCDEHGDKPASHLFFIRIASATNDHSVILIKGS